MSRGKDSTVKEAEKTQEGGKGVQVAGQAGCLDRTASLRKAESIEFYVLRWEADSFITAIGS